MNIASTGVATDQLVGLHRRKPKRARLGESLSQARTDVAGDIESKAGLHEHTGGTRAGVENHRLGEEISEMRKFRRIVEVELGVDPMQTVAAFARRRRGDIGIGPDEIAGRVGDLKGVAQTKSRLRIPKAGADPAVGGKERAVGLAAERASGAIAFARHAAGPDVVAPLPKGRKAQGLRRFEVEGIDSETLAVQEGQPLEVGHLGGLPIGTLFRIVPSTR